MTTINVKDAAGATVAVARVVDTGQALAADSMPVVLTAAQLTTLTPPAAITGFATAANQATDLTQVGGVTEAAPASDTASSGLNGRLQRIAQRLTSLIALLPASLGIKTAAASLSVVAASDGIFATTAGPGPATSTRTTVASAATSNTILAANAARKGALILNTDANALRLRLAAGTADATDIPLLYGDTFLLGPGEYTGVITGVWDADGSGQATVYEFTA